MDLALITQLLREVERKDQSTAAHTWRVTMYAQAVAEAFGIEPDTCRRIMTAATLHDIGKIDVPDRILGKPDGLTDAEYEIIQSHTVMGYDRLVSMGVEDPLVLALVRSHHERLDGSGYPDGLVGDEIPDVARHFAVIDTFDAMTSLRPYRTDVGSVAADRAIRELRRKAGEWYCPEAVEMFEELYRSGSLDWILHHLNNEAAIAELPPVPDLSDDDWPEIEIVRSRNVRNPTP